MITIVTSRSFILCESINHIILQSEPEYVNEVRIDFYCINIDFVPGTRNNPPVQSNAFGSLNKNEERGFVQIKVIGENTALKLFKELISQIREQIPDQAYLDKMIENILSGAIGDIHDDKQPEKVSGTRSKKRGSKEVLRRTKSSSKRSKR